MLFASRSWIMALLQTATTLPSIRCLNMLQCSTTLSCTVSRHCHCFTATSTVNWTLSCPLFAFCPLIIGSILEVLNDPAFERSQPSWIRRSRHSATKGGAETEQLLEEIKTEFEDENDGETVFLAMVRIFIPQQSEYMAGVSFDFPMYSHSTPVWITHSAATWTSDQRQESIGKRGGLSSMLPPKIWSAMITIWLEQI